MLLHYNISDVAPYINWVYFYYAWQLKHEAEQNRMRQEAEQMLASFEGKYCSHAVFKLFEAYNDGDDIVLENGDRIALLRQQQAGSEYLCLSDFIAPRSDNSFGHESKIGLFATSVDSGLEKDFDNDPYVKMMAQLLADRLAEATAERLHEEVRKHYWGYAKDEHLSMDELHQEHFQGIRPAVGYPSLPDTSLNFVIDQLIDMKQVGIRLTENGAMRPHASVSGMMLSHPKAHYFAIGKIGNDQLHDYARRRSVPVELARKFLAANL